MPNHITTRICTNGMRKMLLGAHHIYTGMYRLLVYTVHTELRKRFEPCEATRKKFGKIFRSASRVFSILRNLSSLFFKVQ